MEMLFALIQQIHPMPPDFNKRLASMLQKKQFDKKAFLLIPGLVSNKIYFLEKGLVRGYYLKEDKDITTGFLAEGSFVISPVSFYTQQPSFEYLELLEDSILWSITFEQIQSLYLEFTEFNIIGRFLTEQYYVRSELRAHHLRMLGAEEKYHYFVNQYVTIINRLSIKHIASFIGLTPETISRIRSKKD